MRRPVTLCIVGALCATASCYPDQIVTNVSQLASVTTLVDSGPPLQSARTFAMPDTIVHAMRAQGADIISHENDHLLLSYIRSQFIADGWIEITDVPAQTPDVIVLTTVLEFTNTGVAYSDWWGGWGWYGGWPAGYGADWAWGYPSNAVTFEYETGTLGIVMLDTRHGDTKVKRVPLIWAGAVNGVITTSAVQGTINGIDQIFTQSPYLVRP